MWTRKELKEKGKASFKANYWKAVLVGLIFSIIAGGISGGFSGGNMSDAIDSPFSMIGNGNDLKKDLRDVSQDLDDAADDIDEAKEDIQEAVEEAAGEGVVVNIDEDDSPSEAVKELSEAVDKAVGTKADRAALTAVGVMIAVVAVIVTIIVLVISFALSAFLLNPIEMGCDRFFFRNLREPVEIAKNVFHAFDHSYLNVVKTLFFRDLYTFLWSLLFVIPGIVKAYEYRMIPYLLAEDPSMDSKEAFEKSRAMMSGNKWKAFVLDLSFIGWDLLSILTCGILSVFYVTPYQRATSAALYDALRDKDDFETRPMIEEKPVIEEATEA